MPTSRKRADATAKSRAEAPTLPPPSPNTGRNKSSGIRAKRKSTAPAATVDEVIADMRNDPRREEED